MNRVQNLLKWSGPGKDVLSESVYAELEDLQECGCGARFQGGVAGGIPPHKGGPQARPPKRRGESEEE